MKNLHSPEKVEVRGNDCVGIFFENVDTHEIVYATDSLKSILGVELKGENSRTLFRDVENWDTDVVVSGFLGKELKITFLDKTMYNNDHIQMVTVINLKTVMLNESWTEELDELTGVFNKRAGISELNRNINIVKRNPQSVFSIAYINIDKTGKINEELGRESGDKLLKSVVNTAKTCIRNTDVFARLHDDNFIIIFPSCTVNVAHNIMSTLSTKLSAVEFEGGYKTSISYGVIEVNTHTYLDSNFIIETATAKMCYMKGR